MGNRSSGTQQRAHGHRSGQQHEHSSRHRRSGKFKSPRTSQRQLRRACDIHPEAYVPHVDEGVLQRLHSAYRKGTQEIGYRTDGHKCVTTAEVDAAKENGNSLLYGEVLPSSVVKMLDERHLHAASAKVLVDLGSGTGKLVMQAFLMYPNLDEVVGVELCQSRFRIAERAALQLASRFSTEYVVVDWVQGEYITVSSRGKPRYLMYRCGDLLTMPNLHMADIVVLQTDLPTQTHAALVDLLGAGQLHPQVRVLSYLNLADLWASVGAKFYLEQHPTNRSPHDRYLTSWSYVHGHHFYVWHHPRHSHEGGRVTPHKSTTVTPTGVTTSVRQTLPHTVPGVAVWRPVMDSKAGMTTRGSFIQARSMGGGDGEDDAACGSVHGPSQEVDPPSACADTPLAGPSNPSPRSAGSAASAPSRCNNGYMSPFTPVAKHSRVSVETDSDELSPPNTPAHDASVDLSTPDNGSRRASEDSCATGSSHEDVRVVPRPSTRLSLGAGDQEPGLRSQRASVSCASNATTGAYDSTNVLCASNVMTDAAGGLQLIGDSGGADPSLEGSVEMPLPGTFVLHDDASVVPDHSAHMSPGSTGSNAHLPRRHVAVGSPCDGSPLHSGSVACGGTSLVDMSSSSRHYHAASSTPTPSLNCHSTAAINGMHHGRAGSSGGGDDVGGGDNVVGSGDGSSHHLPVELPEQSFMQRLRVAVFGCTCMQPSQAPHR